MVTLTAQAGTFAAASAQCPACWALTAAIAKKRIAVNCIVIVWVRVGLGLCVVVMMVMCLVSLTRGSRGNQCMFIYTDTARHSISISDMQLLFLHVCFCAVFQLAMGISERCKIIGQNGSPVPGERTVITLISILSFNLKDVQILQYYDTWGRLRAVRPSFRVASHRQYIDFKFRGHK